MARTLLDAAQDHQDRREALAARTAATAVRLFNRIPTSDLDYGWSVVGPGVVSAVTASQITAANQSTGYTDRVARLQGVEVKPAALVPQAFAGVTLEGREVGPQLFAAVTRTKDLIGKGYGVPQAFRAGAALMSILASSLVHDIGRSSDLTIATGKGFTRSVRVVSPGACSRCAILAGVTGYRTEFKRHPKCRCTSLPIRDGEDAPKGFFSSTDDYFASLSKAEQDRVFTNSGAEAIRLGADPAKVVNARLRGGRAALPGTPRINAGGDTNRRTTARRVMPEQIMTVSTSPENARELLSQYGYLQ